MSNREIVNREMINTLLVKLFNQIIDIEEMYLLDRGVNDISLSELHLLEKICSFTNPTMSEIAKRATLTNGTVTTAVKRLEKKGYLMRKQDENDRRIMRVYVTNKGLQVERIHHDFHDEMVARVCEDTDALNNDMLINALRNLSYFFEELRDRYDGK